MTHRKPIHHRILIGILIAAGTAGCASARKPAPAPVPSGFRGDFLKLCDTMCVELSNKERKQPYFVDSYAIRAMNVAWDMTGEKRYLDACMQWSDRMVECQSQMTPAGAYYMNYNRKPGETTGRWYIADSASIAMGILATAVRCEKPVDHYRYLASVKAFAKLVMDNYLGRSGGIRNGLWPKSDDEWWCSSGIFGSLAFLLYNETGDEAYLDVALGTIGWLNKLDLNTAGPMTLKEMGPTMYMYVLEAYSAGFAHLPIDGDLRKEAATRIEAAAQWLAEHPSGSESTKAWPLENQWGSKYGGFPFHLYIYSKHSVNGEKLIAQGDVELTRIGEVLKKNEKLVREQLAPFAMMSYAERLSPGAIYRSSKK